MHDKFKEKREHMKLIKPNKNKLNVSELNENDNKSPRVRSQKQKRKLRRRTLRFIQGNPDPLQNNSHWKDFCRGIVCVHIYYCLHIYIQRVLVSLV